MTSGTLRHRDLEPTHPGELLDDIVIPATGKTKVEIAKLLGISRQSLYTILGKAQSVTPDMALRLGKLFGDGPDVWLRMQMAHDLWRASKEIEADLDEIPTLQMQYA